MNLFVARLRDMIKGIITGFDRIVFKGAILPLAHAAGAMSFCQSHGIRNKDFKRWAIEQARQVVESAEQYAQTHTGRGIQPIFSSKVRKEDVAHARQQEMGIASGLIGVTYLTVRASPETVRTSIADSYTEHALIARLWRNAHGPNRLFTAPRMLPSSSSFQALRISVSPRLVT